MTSSALSQTYWQCFILLTSYTSLSFPPTTRCLKATGKTPGNSHCGCLHISLCAWVLGVKEILSLHRKRFKHLLKTGECNYTSRYLLREEKELNSRQDRAGKDLNRVRKNTDEPSAHCAKLLHKMHKIVNKKNVFSAGKHDLFTYVHIHKSIGYCLTVMYYLSFFFLIGSSGFYLNYLIIGSLYMQINIILFTHYLYIIASSSHYLSLSSLISLGPHSHPLSVIFSLPIPPSVWSWPLHHLHRKIQ